MIPEGPFQLDWMACSPSGWNTVILRSVAQELHQGQVHSEYQRLSPCSLAYVYGLVEDVFANLRTTWCLLLPRQVPHQLRMETLEEAEIRVVAYCMKKKEINCICGRTDHVSHKFNYLCTISTAIAVYLETFPPCQSGDIHDHPAGVTEGGCPLLEVASAATGTSGRIWNEL